MYGRHLRTAVINVRVKGAEGEREVCSWLNKMTHEVLLSRGVVKPSSVYFIRNQNQTAIGGADIENPLGLCIEVKRQETLQTAEWWKQCVKASETFGGFPIVLYRQNGRRKWRAILRMSVVLDSKIIYAGRCEIEHEEFERFFRLWVLKYFLSGKWVP